MSMMKRFLHFCQECDLNSELNSTARAFSQYIDAGERELDISDGRDLTFEDIDILTGGRLGVFNIPCPYCGQNKLWSTCFRIDRRTLAFAWWRCFYCGRGGTVHADGIDPEQEKEARRKSAQFNKERSAERTAGALKLWNEAQPINNNVISYFHARKITELPPNVDEVLRWHSHCPFGPRNQCGCMLALFRDARKDNPVAILRTRISATGAAERKALGPIAGAAIKLWPATDRLVWGEGLKTVLSAAQMREYLKPAWAGTVANNVARLPLIRGVKRLVILGENDQSNTGYLKSFEVYERWTLAGRDASILMPDQLGLDFNDILRGGI
jgi:hypothetical protein